MHSSTKKEYIKVGLFVTLVTFFIAMVMSIGSQTLVQMVNNRIVAFLLLFVIIILGIVFDIIGTAVTAAELSPFNAMAARKVAGANIAVSLVKKADAVANFCNDIVGDIAGTLSGAIGAGIAISLIYAFSFLDVIILSSIMTSLIAGVTVGGKAIGKKFAIKHANKIIFKVAVLLIWWEKLTGLGSKGKKRR